MKKSIQICYSCVHRSHLKYKIQKREMVKVHIMSLTTGSNRNIKFLGVDRNRLCRDEEKGKTCRIKSVSYADKVFSNNPEIGKRCASGIVEVGKNLLSPFQ